ncbi:MAG: ABC transporter substrate-binding protein, partial [Chloroflexi bacterium]|nr:ABC transporter substrate-binding protein [Chloroflexota bacterium]
MAGTGLSAAALLGCGSDESETAPTTAQPAPAAPAAPANGVAAPAPGTIPDGVLMPRVAGAPTYGGTFNDGVAFTNAVHDMHTAGAGTVWHVLGGRGMRLGAFSGELEAEMVEEWEVVDDQGLELLMHVRPGMALHDKEPWNGRDFNAEDLAFNLERNVGLYAEAEGLPLTSFQRRSMVAGLSTAEAVDDRTVRLSMTQPNGAIFNGMIDSRMVLMPKGVVEVGFDDPTKFAGVGPFTMSEFRPGEQETYVKHPNFYRGQPYFDSIRKTVIGDRASQVAALIDRQTDLLSGAVERERDAQFFEYPGVNWWHIRWNHLNEVLADPRVRQAFWLATDRGEIMSGFFGAGWGLAGVAVTAFPESWDAATLETLPGYNPATRDADRAEAARLMEAA